MSAHVFLGGQRLVLKPQQLLGRGGEAEVYDIGHGRALKLYKPPDHPDYALSAEERDAARDRLATVGAKLRAMPPLPAGVVRPEELATDRAGRDVLGYAMRLVGAAEPLLRYGEPSFRRAGAPNEEVLAVFEQLRETVVGIHAAHVVIGDFNDLNVLVAARTPHVVDADSVQFGPYLCRVFTERFLDPLRLEPSGHGPRLARPASAASDWYAFAAMLMQSLLFVGPYGGIHRPKGARVSPVDRPLQRITVFHPEVQYPKPASAPESLPDDLLHQLHRVFEKDDRAPFPAPLLQPTRWATCRSCGLEHARAACPACRPYAAAPLQRFVTVRGAVTARRLFGTEGVILHAAVQNGRARWLYHCQGALRRDDGAQVLRRPLDPSMQVALHGDVALVARDGELTAISPGVSLDRFSVDAGAAAPAFAATAAERYWAQGGTLWRLGPLGPEAVGEVLEGHTRLWAGPTFGLGLYRAGAVEVAFVFRHGRRGLNDSLQLPRLPGTLVDARCELGEERAFLLRASEHRGRVIHQCIALDAHGHVLAAHEASRGDGSWLSRLEGKCAAGHALLAATDAGLHRVEIQGSDLVKTRDFPDCEPFVAERTRLLVDQSGVVAVSRNEVLSLQMS